MNIYSALKLLHLGAVILFLGNIITGLFWMRRADRTNDLSLISFTMKGIIASDKWFTIPGVIIITAGGFGAAVSGGLPLLRTGWIFWSIVLFSISGVVFAIKVVPLQQKVYKLTFSEAEGFDWSLYRSQLKEWERWGLIALLTPLAAMAMMVLKIPVASIF